MKRYLITFLKCILITIMCSFVCLGLMILVYMIPKDRIRENALSSSAVFEKEGPGPKIWYFYSTALDNNTDALMMLVASNQSESDYAESALLNFYEENDMLNACEVLSLVSIDGNDPSIQEKSYARYWHGYLLWLKPALYYISYRSVRVINLIIQIALSSFIIYLLHSRGYRYVSLGYLCRMMILWPISSGFSMQYHSCFYLLSIGTLWMILHRINNRTKESIWVCYLMLGIMTAFFDFLTYPVTTLFVPLIVTVVLFWENDEKKRFVGLIEPILSWCVGYVGMWSMKWILSSVFTQENIIKDAINSVMIRTSYASTPIYMGILLNIGAFAINPFTIISVIIGIIIVVKEKVGLKRNGLVFLFIGLVPLLWYCFAANHSYAHFWFAFRNMIIPVLCFYGYVEIQKGKQGIGDNY